jgi:hypothetical protein
VRRLEHALGKAEASATASISFAIFMAISDIQ